MSIVVIKLHIMKYILLIIPIFLFSCYKKEPKPGAYIGTFNGNYFESGVSINKFRSHPINIITSNKDQIILVCGNIESKLAKDKNIVKGTFETDKYIGTGFNQWDGQITIDGQISKANGEFIITGNFTSTFKYLNSVNNQFYSYPVLGTFQIKPNL